MEIFSEVRKKYFLEDGKLTPFGLEKVLSKDKEDDKYSLDELIPINKRINFLRNKYDVKGYLRWDKCTNILIDPPAIIAKTNTRNIEISNTPYEDLEYNIIITYNEYSDDEHIVISKYQIVGEKKKPKIFYKRKNYYSKNNFYEYLKDNSLEIREESYRLAVTMCYYMKDETCNTFHVFNIKDRDLVTERNEFKVDYSEVEIDIEEIKLLKSEIKKINEDLKKGKRKMAKVGYISFEKYSAFDFEYYPSEVKEEEIRTEQDKDLDIKITYLYPKIYKKEFVGLEKEPKYFMCTGARYYFKPTNGIEVKDYEEFKEYARLNKGKTPYLSVSTVYKLIDKDKKEYLLPGNKINNNNVENRIFTKIAIKKKFEKVE